MSNNNIPILMYHSIADMPKSTVMRSLHVSKNRFKHQMWLLKFLGYRGLSLKDLKKHIEYNKTEKVFGITFDDGYRNNLVNAAPILKKYNFSATCFIVNDAIGKSNIWDLSKKITQQPLMTEDEIHQWLDFGMDIGGHSKTHPDLTSIPEEKARLEITGCKVELEKKFGVNITDFCYPFGCFNDSIYNLVKEAGYITAVTMLRGKLNSESDDLMLPRVPVNYRTLPHLFLTKILTNYENGRT